MLGRDSLPGFGIWVFFALFMGRHLVAPVGMARLAHDPGIVAATRQDKGDVGVGEQMDLEDRAPGRNMVSDGAHREDGRADVP